MAKFGKGRNFTTVIFLKVCEALHFHVEGIVYAAATFFRADVLPYEVGAFLQTYWCLYKTMDCSPKAVEQKCRKWKPYSSVAARFFYRTLDMGLTRNEFHLYKEDTK